MSKHVTRTLQLAAARRELEKREKNYPQWVADKRLKPEVAEAELAAMAAIVGTLEMLVLLEEVGNEMKAEAVAKVTQAVA